MESAGSGSIPLSPPPPRSRFLLLCTYSDLKVGVCCSYDFAIHPQQHFRSEISERLRFHANYVVPRCSTLRKEATRGLQKRKRGVMRASVDRKGGNGPQIGGAWATRHRLHLFPRNQLKFYYEAGRGVKATGFKTPVVDF